MSVNALTLTVLSALLAVNASADSSDDLNAKCKTCFDDSSMQSFCIMTQNSWMCSSEPSYGEQCAVSSNDCSRAVDSVLRPFYRVQVGITVTIAICVLCSLGVAAVLVWYYKCRKPRVAVMHVSGAYEQPGYGQMQQQQPLYVAMYPPGYVAMQPQPQLQPQPQPQPQLGQPSPDVAATQC